MNANKNVSAALSSFWFISNATTCWQYNPETGEVVREFDGHLVAARNCLVTYRMDEKKIRFYNDKTGELLAVFDTAVKDFEYFLRRVTSHRRATLRYFRKNKWFISDINQTLLYDTVKNEVIRTFVGTYHEWMESNRGYFLYTISGSNVNFYNIKSDKPLYSFYRDEKDEDCWWSYDPDIDAILVSDRNKTLLYSIARRKILFQFPAPVQGDYFYFFTGEYRDCEFFGYENPQPRLIVSSSGCDGITRIYNIRTGELEFEFPGSFDRVYRSARIWTYEVKREEREDDLVEYYRLYDMSDGKMLAECCPDYGRSKEDIEAWIEQEKKELAAIDAARKEIVEKLLSHGIDIDSVSFQDNVFGRYDYDAYYWHTDTTYVVPKKDIERFLNQIETLWIGTPIPKIEPHEEVGLCEVGLCEEF
jgi:WD40 repeat protein